MALTAASTSIRAQFLLPASAAILSLESIVAAFTALALLTQERDVGVSFANRGAVFAILLLAGALALFRGAHITRVGSNSSWDRAWLGLASMLQLAWGIYLIRIILADPAPPQSQVLTVTIAAVAIVIGTTLGWTTLVPISKPS